MATSTRRGFGGSRRDVDTISAAGFPCWAERTTRRNFPVAASSRPFSGRTRTRWGNGGRERKPNRPEPNQCSVVSRSWLPAEHCTSVHKSEYSRRNFERRGELRNDGNAKTTPLARRIGDGPNVASAKVRDCRQLVKTRNQIEYRKRWNSQGDVRTQVANEKRLVFRKGRAWRTACPYLRYRPVGIPSRLFGFTFNNLARGNQHETFRHCFDGCVGPGVSYRRVGQRCGSGPPWLPWT